MHYPYSLAIKISQTDKYDIDEIEFTLFQAIVGLTSKSWKSLTAMINPRHGMNLRPGPSQVNNPVLRVFHTFHTYINPFLNASVEGWSMA